jgi:hypothetical protein
MKKNQQLGFSGLHLLLALSLPFVLAFLLGCKRAKEERADLGPEVSGEAIDQALAKAIAGASLRDLRKDQSVQFSILRRIENADTVMLMGSTAVNVMAARDSDDGSETKYTMRIVKTYRRDDGSFREIQSEDPIVVENPGSTSSASNFAPLVTHSASAHELKASFLQSWAKSVTAKAGESQPASRVTFHHLRESDEIMPVPDRVKNRANCGGVNNCEMHVHIIHFDLVSWFSDTDYQKVTLDFGFSLDTPLLPFGDSGSFDQLTGLLMLDCRSTYVQFESRNVYVRDCMTLDDLQK